MRVRPYTHISPALGAVFLTALTAAASAASPSPYGVWYDHDGRGAIEIKPCGTKLCGRLVWAKDPKDAKKGCGKFIIKNVRKVSSSTWDGGKIYSPEKGSTYDVELKPISDSKLRVVGYLGTKLFSQTFIWRRAPANLPRCDAPDTPIEAKKKSAPKVAKKSSTPAPAALGAPPKAKAPKSIAKAREKTPKTTTTAKIDDTPPDVVAPKPSRAERVAPAPRDADVARDEPIRGKSQTPANGNDDPDDEVASIDNDNDDFGNDDDFEDSDEKSGSKPDMCRLEVPFVTISFPCKK